jgi:hypothetical protein
MSIPFGFGFGSPDDPSSNGDPNNPLAGLGEMLQSLGRAMSQAQGQSAVTGAGLIAAAAADSTSAPALSANAAPATLDGLAGLCAGWVDAATDLPATPAELTSWTPKQWMQETADDWARFAAPVADTISEATTAMMQQADIPDEQRLHMAAMLQPMQQMMKSMTIAMMQQQLGTAIGKLSNDVLYAAELPMVAPTNAAAVLPAAIDQWASGLELPADQVYPWIVTREVAAHRLAATATWLPGLIRNAVLAHSSGVHIDQSKIAEAMQSVDPTNAEAMQELLHSGVLEPAQSPAQEMALSRLQTLIALVDGWTDVVCADASPAWVPVAQLDEAYRRRRATNSPAQQALGALVGLEINPRRVREAAELWRRITESHGVAVRDGLWGHPDLLPGADDLGDPTSFIDAIGAADPGMPE